MPRRLRIATGGYVYHVLNRAVGRRKIFRKDEDYAAFQQVLEQVHQRLPTMRLLGYCLMPNHWHLLLWPREDGQLSEFLRLLTVTHTQRWHAHHHSAGTGPLYQGRFRSFPIQQDGHLLRICRYVERNPLAAELVDRPEQWKWGSAYARTHKQQRPDWLLAESLWPLRWPGPSQWLKLLHTPLAEDQRQQIQQSLERGSPLGEAQWVRQTAKRLSLESTLRPRGRPRKQPRETQEARKAK